MGFSEFPERVRLAGSIRVDWHAAPRLGPDRGCYEPNGIMILILVTRANLGNTRFEWPTIVRSERRREKPGIHHVNVKRATKNVNERRATCPQRNRLIFD